MISIKSPQEIKILSEGGKILASILNEVASRIRPGISAEELDKCVEVLIRKAGGKPSFLGYSPRGSKSPYPASLCVSINEEVVHSIPSSSRILKEGDIVSLDAGLEYKNLHTDTAVTVGVGKISPLAEKLIKVTKQCFSKGRAVLKEDATLGDYGFAVQSCVEKAGFNVVRKLVGHGVGYSVHEDPDVPNFGKKGTGLKLRAGMVLALEPMVCEGSGEVVLDKDGWTWRTKDGLLSAHFEHTIVIEKEGCRVLTASDAVLTKLYN